LNIQETVEVEIKIVVHIQRVRIRWKPD